jgi:hypothetical protein
VPSKAIRATRAETLAQKRLEKETEARQRAAAMAAKATATTGMLQADRLWESVRHEEAIGA